METPSLAFLRAWVRPLTSARSFSEMANPAASSAELVIRDPDDSLFKAFPCALLLTPNVRWAAHRNVIRVDP